jgi:putative nucleotidyltransferase with HDIG domain
MTCECFALATFEFASDGLCIAKLHLRERSHPSMFTFADRVVSSETPAELQSVQSLKIVLGAHTPEFLLPLAERGMRLAEVFPILLDGKLCAALVCAGASQEAMSEEDRSSARAVADRLTVGLSNMSLIDALEQMNWGTLTALARAIDAKSAWTAGHSERVTQMALRLARAMDLPDRDLQIMQRGGLLHDIGKIGTPLEILDKPGKLADHEMAIMREHVQTGVRILEPVAAFADALPIVAQHHEWFNGRGYPAGLAGEEITLHARIFAVADCYDALISDRPYRKGLPQERVVQMLAENSGKQFDPQVIKVLLQIFSDDTPGNPQEVACLTGQNA